MSTDSGRKVRLVKNSFYLYGRSIIQMIVSLITVRLTLKYLGIENYGLYNLLSALVVACSFVNASLVSASNRYITYAIGTGDIRKVSSTFSYSKRIQGILVVVLFFAAELIGILLILFKLSIPEGSLWASLVVYQIAVITFLFNVFIAPYKSLLSAYERFDAISFASILDSGLKLTVVCLLPLFHSRLIPYAVLMGIAQIIPLLYQLRVANKYANDFRQSEMVPVFDQKKDYLEFAGWNMFGAVGQISMNQGYNFLINLFYGVVFNAAHALAFQINGYIVTFTSAFTMALQPQIIKSFSAKDMSYYNKIMITGCKVSFLLIMIIALPLAFEIEYILDLWLGEYPPYAPVLIRLILINVTINNIAAPLSYAIEASGKIRMTQVINGSLMFLSIFVVYLFYSMGLDCYVAYVVMIIVTILAQVTRLYYASKYASFRVEDYFKKAFIPILGSAIIEIIFLIAISFNFESSFVRVLLCGFLPLVAIIPFNYLLASEHERSLIKKALSVVIKRIQ